MKMSPQEIDTTNLTVRCRMDSVYYGEVVDETAVALGANASFTGATFTTCVDAAGAALTSGTPGTQRINVFGFVSFADQAGTAVFQDSYDGTTNFRTMFTVSCAASTLKQTAQFTDFCYGSVFVRSQYTNGGTIQTTFEYRTSTGNSV